MLVASTQMYCFLGMHPDYGSLSTCTAIDAYPHFSKGTGYGNKSQPQPEKSKKR